MQLGDNLHIPAPTQEGKRFGFLGKSGSGKTNSLLILARELIHAGWVVIVIDPMNNFRALKAAELPVIVAGNRQSSDVRVTADNALLLADFSFTRRVSVVIDTMMLEDEMIVLQPFLQMLWRHILRQDENGPFTPLALLIDEAQLYIPEFGKTDVSGLIQDMGKRGRQLHLSMAIASQRPASVKKDFLTQSNLMIFHQLRSVDIKPVLEELPLPEKEVRAIMRKFVKGQALVTGDPDMVDTGEEDYIITRIKEWDGAPLPPIQAGTQQPLQGIDAAALNKLRKSMEKATAPKSLEAQSRPDNGSLYEQLYQRTLAQLGALLASYSWSSRRWQQLEMELNQRLDKQARELSLARKHELAVVEAVEGIETDKADMEQRSIGLLPDDVDYRSPRAINRGMNKQERAFAQLKADLRALPRFQLTMLCYLSQYEGQELRLNEIARFIGISSKTMLDKPPTILMRRGLLKRRMERGRGQFYKSTLTAYLTGLCPDLDTDELIDQIIRLGNLG